MAEIAEVFGQGGELLDLSSLEVEITEVVVRGLAGRYGARDAPGPRHRRSFTILADADDFAAARGWRGISISEVCRALEVSETQLRRAFRDVVHCSPKRLFTVRALNAARAALMDARPEDTTVSDTAAEFGFWHFGRVARDYRRLFGELPSATLRSG
jgi:AraC family ethanolamine operon transcriptional activator